MVVKLPHIKNAIEIINLTKVFGKLAVFDKLNLKISKKITCIVGPNGCDKTTLIFMIANLLL